MAGFMYQIFSEAEFRKYKSSICSSATLITVIFNLLAVIVTFALLTLNSGPWKREVVYDEQPKVVFKKDILVKLTTLDSYYIATTYENIKVAYPENLKILQPMEKEVDDDGDGDADYLDLNLPIYLSAEDSLSTVEIFLIFDYQLKKKVTLQMESLVYVHAYSSGEVSGLNITGDLTLVQPEPLTQSQVATIYSTPVISRESVYPEDFYTETILTNYNLRNATTSLGKMGMSWTYGQTAFGKPFNLNVFIRYAPELAISARPEFWEELLYGFTKFLPIFIMVYYILDTLLAFILQHQLVPSVLFRPTQAHFKTGNKKN